MNASFGCNKVEQRVEPAKKAAQIIYKKLVGCLQSQQGLDSERRMVSPYSIMWIVSVLDEILKQIKQLLYMKNE